MSRTARKLLNHINAWPFSTKICCCVGVASLASATKLRGKKVEDDELCNQYWAKVLAAEEEALQNVRPWQQLDFLPIHATKEEDIRKSKKGQFLHKNYTFGKPYEADVSNVVRKIKTSIPVKPLHYPFEPSTEPPPTNTPLNMAQWRRAFTQARIYLLGVTHYNHKSQLDAIKLVNAVQPDILMLEVNMEEGHAELLYLTDAKLKQLAWQPFEEYLKEVNAERQKKGYPPILHLPKEIQLTMEKAEAERYGTIVTVLQKGLEFRTAFQKAQQVPGCVGAVLGDNLANSKKIVENLMKGVKCYDIWQYFEYLQLKWRMKKIPHLYKGRYTDKEIAAKQEEMIEKFKKFGHPEFGEHLLHERNRWRFILENKFTIYRNMIRVLHTIVHRCTIEKFCASQKAGVPFEPVTVVALVGAAHLYGIINEWAKPEVVYAANTTRTTRRSRMTRN